ncbi:DUF1918 domain-containing protein [Microbacterium neungamense]|uniref:DUF1918 domain-containing protein n=1 Tax=Microbacterium neungamense TaxID=2810535 RepID=UPI00217E4010|nr:DUF1918 domain-containing protein [Microbacterium neungamense]UWF78156.1 DUF1918 domain-containing protein [Microbacterium neungamense]
MQITAGSRVVIHGARVGRTDRHGEVLEARGEDGGPPYLIRFDDGHESLVFPGPDCELEHASGDAAATSGDAAAAGSSGQAAG